MKWKDFFFYSENDKRGILLLLVLVILLFILLLFWNKHDYDSPQIAESDSLKNAFETYQKALIADEKAEYEKSYAENKRKFYEKYKYENDYASAKYTNKAGYEKKDFTKPTYVKQEKLAAGEKISLNEADTNGWKKVPGIGSGYAHRIVKYREMLGGFSSISQLKEVYGIDEELYERVKPFVKEEVNVKKIGVNQSDMDQLRSHPYLSYKQAKAIVDLRKRRGKITTIKTLQLLDEFSESDIQRLTPYLSFE